MSDQSMNPPSQSPRFGQWAAIFFFTFFAVNCVPHTGAALLALDMPTPFSGGPGTLSTPFVNALWGLTNVALALVLWRFVKPFWGNQTVRWVMLALAFGFVLMLAWAFDSQPYVDRFV